jgi:hypothetical protein
MKVYFRHGPLDGTKAVVVNDPSLILLITDGLLQQYLKTSRHIDGCRVYQHVGKLLIDPDRQLDYANRAS